MPSYSRYPGSVRRGLGTLIASMLLCQSLCHSLGLLSLCQGAPSMPSILVGGRKLWAALGAVPPVVSLGFLQVKDGVSAMK